MPPGKGGTSLHNLYLEGSSYKESTVDFYVWVYNGQGLVRVVPLDLESKRGIGLLGMIIILRLK